MPRIEEGPFGHIPRDESTPDKKEDWARIEKAAGRIQKPVQPPPSETKLSDALDKYEQAVIETHASGNPRYGKNARSSLESLYREQMADVARMNWFVGAYLGADFKYDYAGQSVSVLLIELPDGARISNDLRATIDTLRISSRATSEEL